MNKAFLEDLAKFAQEFLNGTATLPGNIGDQSVAGMQFYIAQKLWSIEQILIHQGGR